VNLEYIQPTAIMVRRSDINTFAEDMAERLGHDPGSNDIFSIIEKIGGKICMMSDNFNEDDVSLEINSVGDWKIFLSTWCRSYHNNSAAAHELGHYILHYIAQDQTECMTAPRVGRSDDRAEWEANWFAQGFLMPEKKFRKIYDMYGGNLDLVAVHFNVSKNVTRFRAEWLKLI
jgi:Zn-dependent peptidase ImmA (M78 family)